MRCTVVVVVIVCLAWCGLLEHALLHEAIWKIAAPRRDLLATTIVRFVPTYLPYIHYICACEAHRILTIIIIIA